MEALQGRCGGRLTESRALATSGTKRPQAYAILGQPSGNEGVDGFRG
jgi:hypothetical protein